MSNATPDRLDRIESLLEQTSQRVDSNTQAIQELGQKLDHFSEEIKSETAAIRAETEALKETQEKWDERFFEMSRNLTNLAFGLIATATITIIVTSVFK